MVQVFLVKKNIFYFEKSLDFYKKIDYKLISEYFTNKTFVNNTI